MRALALIFPLSFFGCLTPHSLALGQLAAPIGRGANELAVTSGVLYQSQVAPSIGISSAASRGFSLPYFEGNFQHGFTERIGLNAHLSPAGLQPGVKINLTRSKILSLALLPSIGLGYFSYGSGALSTGLDGRQTESNQALQSLFVFQVGLKFLFSHRVGVYGGVGYDLVVSRNFNSSTPILGTRTEDTYSSVQHRALVALGFSANVGRFSIRPELAFAATPFMSVSATTAAATLSGSGGFGFAVLPSITLAAATEPKARTKEDDDEDEANEHLKRREQEDAEDDDETGSN